MFLQFNLKFISLYFGVYCTHFSFAHLFWVMAYGPAHTPDSIVKVHRQRKKHWRIMIEKG